MLNDPISREALDALPGTVADIVQEGFNLHDQAAATALNAHLSRAGDYKDNLSVVLAALACCEPALKSVSFTLAQMWSGQAVYNTSYDEIVIGGGLHGVAYAINRKRPPLILESRNIGGVFGWSESPVFYLNSRNRPDMYGLPRTAQGLNYLPGAPLQPSMIDGAEYQTQDKLRTAIMMALFQYPPNRVGLGWTVVEVKRSNLKGRGTRKYVVTARRNSNGQRVDIYTDRVVFATGLGRSNNIAGPRPQVMTFRQFVERQDDQAFPLAGWKRVAVVGAGDSANVVVERLLGQGPTPAMSTAALDFVDQIDWYGQGLTNPEDFVECSRSRYAGIARYMFSLARSRTYARVFPIPERADKVDSRMCINGKGPYDHVVVCTGFKDVSETFFNDDPLFVPTAALDDSRYLGSKAVEDNYWKIGPCSALPITPEEVKQVPVLREVKENAVAAFRYMPRTVKLARSLP